MQNSTVSFHIDAADSETIDAILAVIRGTTATTSATTNNNEKKKDKPLTMAEVKKAMMAAKKEHGEDFVIDVLSDKGKTEKPDATIARQLSACDAENYPAMLVAFAEGPSDDGNKDDGEIDPEAVVKACRAYTKANSRKDLKAILKPIGVKPADIADATQEQLQKIMKAVV